MKEGRPPTGGEKADRRVHQHCPTCARQTRIESSIEGGNGRISEPQNLAGTTHHPFLPAGRELCQVHRAQGCGTWEIQPLSSSVPPRANDSSFRNRVWPASRPGITHNTAFPNQGWTRVRREKHPGCRSEGCPLSGVHQHLLPSPAHPDLYSSAVLKANLFWAIPRLRCTPGCAPLLHTLPSTVMLFDSAFSAGPQAQQG